MALIKCPECGREVSDKAPACPGCGFAVASAKRCEDCGELLQPGTSFCTKCGCPVESAEQPEAPAPQPIIPTTQPTSTVTPTTQPTSTVTPTTQPTSTVTPTTQPTSTITPTTQPTSTVAPTTQPTSTITPTTQPTSTITPTAQPTPTVTPTTQPTPTVTPTTQPTPTVTPTTQPAPAAHPARAQLGSAQARVRSLITAKTKGANVWVLLATIASFIMFFIIFGKHMKIIGKIEEIAERGGLLTSIASALSDTVRAILNSAGATKWCLIIAMLAAIALFIVDLVRMFGNKLMTAWKLTLPMLFIGVISPHIFGLSNFSNSREVRDLAREIQQVFDANVTIFAVIIAVLFFITLFVTLSVPSVNAFCQTCGNKFVNVPIGEQCPQCKERRLSFGFSPIDRELTKSYPYSGEKLIGQGPVRKLQTAFLIALNSILIVFMIASAPAGLVPVGIAEAVVLLFSIINVASTGIRDEIKVDPSFVSVKTKSGKASIPVSQIIEVLTNESGDVALCIRGKTYTFNEITNRVQIAAALRSLVSKR